MATANWTERAMRAHAGALAEQIEIGVLDPNGRMTRRRGTLEDLLYLTPWLSGRNRQGAHIFVKPWVATGAAAVILVDDLDADAVRRMQADVVVPVAVVETSPRNHQAWVRVSAAPLSTELATAVARVLADRYGGDRNSAVANHYGRLAGFTNTKERYRDAEGRYPWVRVRVVGEGIAPAAAALLAEAAAQVWRQDVVKIERITLPQDGGDVSELGVRFGQEVARIVAREGMRDWSRVEWMVMLDLARRYPEASVEALGKALFEAGQATGLAQRKRGHLVDYIERTVSRALAQAARERAGRRQSKARGASRTAQQKEQQG